MSKYKKDIIRLRRQGKSYNEIEDELDCSKGTIAYHCQRKNLEDIGMKASPISEEKKEKIKALRKKKTIEEVSEALDVSQTTVVKYSESSEQAKTSSKSSDKDLSDDAKEETLKTNTKMYKGELAEEKIAVRFLELGYTVLDPRRREKYDLVIQTDTNTFEKVQCKYVRYKKEYGVMKTCCKEYKYTENQVDYFAGWCREKDEVYVVPFEEAGTTAFQLRFEEAKNGQTKRINYAEDYSVSEDNILRGGRARPKT